MATKVEVPVQQVPVQGFAANNWKGLTLDELKVRRAKQLVLREVSRANIGNTLSNTKQQVSQNGVRGLLFSNNTIMGLKKTDYALLGYKLITLLIKKYARRKK